MAVKIISLFFMFSYFFVSVMTGKLDPIPEDDYPEQMKGVDVTASCGNPQAMEDTCKKIGYACGITDGTTASAPGFPKCPELKIQLQKMGSQEIVWEKYKFIECSWPQGSTPFHFGKGIHKKMIMFLRCDAECCIPDCEYYWD